MALLSWDNKTPSKRDFFQFKAGEYLINQRVGPYFFGNGIGVLLGLKAIVA